MEGRVLVDEIGRDSVGNLHFINETWRICLIMERLSECSSNGRLWRFGRRRRDFI